MSWWGKLVGGAFGFMLGGPLGAVLGAALGHSFDKGLAGIPEMEQLDPGERERVQTAFFTATFSVLGAVAKADGQVSRDEIQLAEAVMTEMDLDAAKRRTAIRLFNQGKSPDFPLDDVVTQFREETHRRRTLVAMFIEIQLQAALADGSMHRAEERLLLHICDLLGLSEFEFRRIERLIGAHAGFAGDAGGPSASRRPSVADAYAVLGVSKSASDEEVKRAYRRLLSQHHPDKLVAKGLPEEMMQLAAQKTHEVKQAYETIKKERALN